ncbi:MAG: type II toxin-antitoxin system HicA family toxin [Burkholderiaceae bacterium]|jgi:predicted RNA binding protein YcfA (HicA-like mRNA interferase family)|nr:type II toxin-antitoxin system HicA family toxin [Burkholderiaceae bacterium]
MNGKQVIAKLKANGWSLARVNGSHHIMSKGGVKVPVPVHGIKDIKAGTLASIARVTGLHLK